MNFKQFQQSKWYGLLSDSARISLNNTVELISIRRIAETVLPTESRQFLAFQVAPHDVKVVILGQDPYPSVDSENTPKAHGLAFGINPDWQGARLVSSFLNVMNEVRKVPDSNGAMMCDLFHWAEQDVLLLNTRLSVELGKPMSHSDLGWENFTAAVLSQLSAMSPNIVYMLWGNEARKYKQHIKSGHILEASHPCKYSAKRSFIGCDHFNKCNAYLTSIGKDPIKWV